MGVDQISKHDHSSDADGGDTISPQRVDADYLTANGSLKLGTDTVLTSVVASGTVALSNGQATIDTGISTGATTATFMIAAAPATDDADVAADVRADSGSGNYEVNIQETDTGVGNPDVNYDIIRVR